MLLVGEWFFLWRFDQAQPGRVITRFCQGILVIIAPVELQRWAAAGPRWGRQPRLAINAVIGAQAAAPNSRNANQAVPQLI